MECEFRHEGWLHSGPITVRGRAFDGDRLLGGAELAARFSGVLEESDEMNALATVADDLEGFYAAVLDPPGEHAYLVADGARSIPLYYEDAGHVVADHGDAVRAAIDAPRDPESTAEFLLTRYVTGPGTIWQGVRSTQAGEIVRLGESPTRRTYRDHWPTGTGRDVDARALLGRGLDRAIDRLVAVADGRHIVVPLSGGYDSRLLAASVAERGLPLTTFTFGRPGHPDVEVSREVADRLDVDWELVEYDPDAWRKWYHGPAGRRLRGRAFGGDALPFVAAHLAVSRLLDSGRVPETALWCPGHSVVTPGERLPVFADEAVEEETRPMECGPAVEADDEPAARVRVEPSVDALVEYILDEHYALWEWDDPGFATAARERIRRGLLGGREAAAVHDAATAAAAYERWEWRGRGTTFTTGDVRGYEVAGADWWLPLWDPAYVRPWQRLTVSDRRGKHAHAALARERYRRVGAVPRDRAGVTDRTLAPVDRLCSRMRHTPARTIRGEVIEWEPRFLAPRSAWRQPGSHPLAWFGIVGPTDRIPEGRSLYALRTLARVGDVDLSTESANLPPDGTITLPTERLPGDA